MSTRRLLITGSGGFIGSSLIEAARSAGWDVTAVDHHSLELTDTVSVRQLVEHSRPEAIVHLAFDMPAHQDDYERALLANSAMLENLDAASTAHSGGAALLVLGSAAEYGPQATTEPWSEDLPLTPVSPYGKIKVQLERRAAKLSRPAIWLRNFNVLGPGQPRGFPVSDWTQRIAERERAGGGTITAGQLNVVRDFLDVRDVAEACLAALELEAGTVANLCSGLPVRLGDLLEQLAELATVPVTIESTDGVASSSVDYAVGSPAKLHSLLSWRPRYALQTSLTDCLQEARRQASIVL